MWTLPATGTRWGISNQLNANIWLYANSVAYAKKNGFEIALHTDTQGKEILGFLPYDEIHLTLNNITAHKNFWAIGKIFAQEAEPLGSIHIDGDVFIKRPDTIDMKLYAKTDLIVQNTERAGFIYRGNLDHVKHALLHARKHDLYEMVNFDRGTAYCCGIAGFNSRELKDAYIAGYRELYNILMSDPDFLTALKNGTEMCPDLVLEQYWLESVARLQRANPYILIDATKIYEHAEKIGFVHVIGHVKYEEENRRKAKENLKLLDKKLYNQLMEREKYA
jgi:hypothetical protein